MAEQQGQIFKLPDAGEAAESIDVRRLPHLISGAAGAQGSDRTEIARQINRVLIAMRTPGHEGAESGLLIAALDGHRLDGLVDSDGRSCRKEAVETLLGCGFPHALQVSPEDLEFARQYQSPSTVSYEEDWSQPGGWDHPLRQARKRGLFVTLGGQALFLLLVSIATTSAGRMVTGLALFVGLLASLVSLGFALSKPNLERQAAWGTLLGLLALIQAGCAAAIGAPAFLGVAGIVAGLLVSLASQYQPRADPPKPGDWDYRDD